MIVWLKILKLAAYRLRLQYFTLNSGLGWHFRIIRFQIAHLKESLDLRWHECHPWEIHNYSNSVLILTWQSWASQKGRSSRFLQEWSLLCCHASTPTSSIFSQPVCLCGLKLKFYVSSCCCIPANLSLPPAWIVHVYVVSFLNLFSPHIYYVLSLRCSCLGYLCSISASLCK